jgi:16S rRNA (cytidine1402-2'-O)-methyltransferase
VTKKLLDKYEFDRPLISYHAHSKLSKTERIFELLSRGKDLALVSDAGTPTISDPGCLLVSQIREKFGNEVAVVPIPGASAVLSALSVSGFPTSEYLFLGFLPHKKGRETLFREIFASKRTVVLYESVHRFEKTLASLAGYLEPNRRILVGRELTKMHEESVLGTPQEVIAHYASNPDRLKGEFVVVVEGK